MLPTPAAQSSSSSASAIERAATLHTTLFVAYLVVLVVTAFLTYLVWHSGNKVQDAVRADANAKIAAASLGVESAKAEAAKAVLGLTKSNEEIARLTSETAEAEERTVALSLKVEEESRKRAVAERELLELQQRVKPRMFTDDQRRSLIDALKRSSPKGLVTITCVLGGGEGFAFASQVDEILKAADWPTTGVNQSVFIPQNPVGLGVVVQSAAAAPPFVGALQRAFGSVGLALPSSELAELTAGTPQLWIGNKPQ